MKRFLILLFSGLFLFFSVFFPWTIRCVDQVELLARGESVLRPVRVTNLWGRTPVWGAWQVSCPDSEILTVKSEPTGVRITPGSLEGEAPVEFRAFPVLRTMRVRVKPLLTDSDHDGFPDVSELPTESDRMVFRDLFVNIARSQIHQESELWQDKDCAGLVRFAYREALKRHDESWFHSFQSVLEQSADITAYHYPRVPLLGDRIFRVKPGEFHLEGGEEDFSVFASARYLLWYNVVFLGKDEHVATRGDLIFFYHPAFFQYPYHVMIYEGRGKVIYHTGPLPNSVGYITETTLNGLRRHPERQWRLAPENPSFLGFYRFKILD